MLLFGFILFDYFSTLVFCHAPVEEANVYARTFMESFGMINGLTLFVLLANLPIYVTLSLDSHLIMLPTKIGGVFEVMVDVVFAWFVAGLHFSGGTSWFWYLPGLTRQALGAIMYLLLSFLLLRLHHPTAYRSHFG